MRLWKDAEVRDALAGKASRKARAAKTKTEAGTSRVAEIEKNRNSLIVKKLEVLNSDRRVSNISNIVIKRY